MTVVSEDPFMLKYCLDKYISQKISYKAVEAFVCPWLVCYK